MIQGSGSASNWCGSTTLLNTAVMHDQITHPYAVLKICINLMRIRILGSRRKNINADPDLWIRIFLLKWCRSLQIRIHNTILMMPLSGCGQFRQIIPFEYSYHNVWRNYTPLLCLFLTAVNFVRLCNFRGVNLSPLQSPPKHKAKIFFLAKIL